MSAPKDLKAIFGRFAGQPLKDPDRMTADIDDVYAQMEQAAQANGFQLRVIFPGKPADFGHNPNRATVFAEVDKNGRFRVGNKFTIG